MMADDNIVKSRNRINIPMKLDVKSMNIPFAIMPAQACDTALGMDVLEKLEATPDTPRRMITYRVPSTPVPVEDIASLRAMSAMTRWKGLAQPADCKPS